MIHKRHLLTESHKEDILKLFYRTELRKYEKLIDNRTITISKELGIITRVVDEFLSIHLDEKFKALNLKVA